MSKEVDKVLPIYIYDETIEIGQASKCWLEKSLEKLNADLNKHNSRLYVFKGNPKIL